MKWQHRGWHWGHPGSATSGRFLFHSHLNFILVSLDFCSPCFPHIFAPLTPHFSHHLPDLFLFLIPRAISIPIPHLFRLLFPSQPTSNWDFPSPNP